MNGRERWFREMPDWPAWRWDHTSAEWNRLDRSLGPTGVGIALAATAAQVIADRAGCGLVEAWDRLAFNFERMTNA